MTVVVESLENQFVGSNFIVQNLHLNIDDEDVQLERAILPNQVIVIAHDLVNDKVVLIEKYRPGGLSISAEFPQDYSGPHESTANAAHRILEEQTGLQAKSLSKANSLMSHTDTAYAPVVIYYATVDTRPLLNSVHPNIKTMGAKELMKEVRWGNMNSLGVVLGASYIKTNRPRR